MLIVVVDIVVGVGIGDAVRCYAVRVRFLCISIVQDAPLIGIPIEYCVERPLAYSSQLAQATAVRDV